MLKHRHNQSPGQKQTRPVSTGGKDDISCDESRQKSSRNRRKVFRNRLILFIIFGVPIQVLLSLWSYYRIDVSSLQRQINATTVDSLLRDPGSVNSGGQKSPTNHACDGYRGIYHIERGDDGGAAGTVFFQFVIGQLIWAEKYNFKPWVYLSNFSSVIYDPIVHSRGPGVDVEMMDGLSISYIERHNGHWRDAYPGAPTGFDNLTRKKFHFDGMGVWEDYFEPVSDFLPGDLSCSDKPIVSMDLYQVTPGIHGFAPWAPKCWRYQYLPDYVTKPHIPLHEWLEPQRHIAHDVLTRYIRFNAKIRAKAEEVNPGCSMSNSCLAVHIRQSDKAAGRRQIETDEFLPFVEAFLKAGGKWVYLATDSGKVMEHIRERWPKQVNDRLRSMGDDIVRSNDHQAVFDIASHHLTNSEILIEILALAKCQFIIHGLSAVTESSIWINVDLHYTSVNLEDPEHLNSNEFSALVEKVLSGGNASQILLEQRPRDWWKESAVSVNSPTGTACDNVTGILHIRNVGQSAGAGTAFFTSVLNQLYYADRFNLKPWVHLQNDSALIFDQDAFAAESTLKIRGMTNGIDIELVQSKNDPSLTYPGEPRFTEAKEKVSVNLNGDGIWNHYFSQVSDFVPGDKSCEGKPIVSLDTNMVIPGLYSFAPWAIRAWRGDEVSDDIWKPNGMPLKTWMEPMRRKANELVKKYYSFKPQILRRAQQVNPVNETGSPCLAIHLRNSDKGKNLYRSKFPVNKFRDYINAFIRAGGQQIYVATDSHRVLEFIEGHFPGQVLKAIKTQGQYVVRSTSKWPIHFLEEHHHRTNSEALVDALAMSKCDLLLHGHSTLSEAAIYLNLNLHNNSVNWEDPDRMNITEFEHLAKEILGTTNTKPVAIKERTNSPDYTSIEGEGAHINVTVLKGDDHRRCRKNAIIYLAQKKHSTYKRDSYGILLQALDLIQKNYLSIGEHMNNTDVMIFHTSDFTKEDIDIFEQRYGNEFRQLIQLVDLQGTKYWRRPSWHKNDNPLEWYAYPLFSEGYRRMMHWFAIDIWQFFRDYAESTGCKYEYIMRFDEDSFLHSPIQYDIFDFMKQNDYNYGFRLCAYEMQVTQRIWKLWRNAKGSPKPIRDIELEMCGVYNNFFVAKISFFQSAPVQRFLKFVDRQGMIYRRRLGDLMIHSMTIYAFSPPEKIHRFLDFTYEHATVDEKTGCVAWGGIQAGYDDPDSDYNLDHFIEHKLTAKGCEAKLTLLGAKSLSPTYAHLPARLGGKVALKTAMVGNVELPGRGFLSG